MRIRQRIRAWLGLDEDHNCMDKMRRDIEENNRYCNKNSKDIIYIIKQLKMGNDVSTPIIFEYLLKRIQRIEDCALERQGLVIALEKRMKFCRYA